MFEAKAFSYGLKLSFFYENNINRLNFSKKYSDHATFLIHKIEYIFGHGIKVGKQEGVNFFFNRNKNTKSEYNKSSKLSFL